MLGSRGTFEALVAGAFLIELLGLHRTTDHRSVNFHSHHLVTLLGLSFFSRKTSHRFISTSSPAVYLVPAYTHTFVVSYSPRVKDSWCRVLGQRGLKENKAVIRPVGRCFSPHRRGCR